MHRRRRVRRLRRSRIDAVGRRGRGVVRVGRGSCGCAVVLTRGFAFDERKALLKAAGIRDGRLHDARHTAGTVLLILGIPDTVGDVITGWEPGRSARMRLRCQHLTAGVLKDAADKIGVLLWNERGKSPAA